MSESGITSSVKYVNGKRIICMSNDMFKCYKEKKTTLLLRRKDCGLLDLTSKDPKYNLKSLWSDQVDIRNLVNAGLLDKATYGKFVNGDISRYNIEEKLRDNLIGTSTGIVGLYFQQLDEYLTIEEAYDREYIDERLFLQLLLKMICTGVCVSRNEHTNEFEVSPYRIYISRISQKYDNSLIGGIISNGVSSVLGFGENKRTTNDMLVVHRLDFETALNILEAQILTGGLIDPKHNVRYSAKYFLQQNLIAKALNEDIENGNIFHQLYGINKSMTEIWGNENSFKRRTLSVKLSGKEAHELQALFLISNTVGPIGTRDSIKFGTAWHTMAKLGDLEKVELVTAEEADDLCAGLVRKSDFEQKLKPWLRGLPMPIAGVVMSHTGKRMTINESVNNGIINDGLGVALLEAQAANGFIIDGITGEPVDIDEAVKRNLIHPRRVQIIKRVENAISGFDFKNMEGEIEHISTLSEAMKKKLIPHEHGLRLLEAQIATGGVIDRDLNCRVRMGKALQSGLVSREIAEQLQKSSTSPVFRGFVDPNTGDNLTYRVLLQRCIPDEVHGLPMIVCRLRSLSNTTRARSTSSLK